MQNAPDLVMPTLPNGLYAGMRSKSSTPCNSSKMHKGPSAHETAHLKPGCALYSCPASPSFVAGRCWSCATSRHLATCWYSSKPTIATLGSLWLSTITSSLYSVVQAAIAPNLLLALRAETALSIELTIGGYWLIRSFAPMRYKCVRHQCRTGKAGTARGTYARGAPLVRTISAQRAVGTRYVAVECSCG